MKYFFKMTPWLFSFILLTFLVACGENNDAIFDQHARDAKEKLENMGPIEARPTKVPDSTHVVVMGYDSTYDAMVQDGNTVPLKNK